MALTAMLGLMGGLVNCVKVRHSDIDNDIEKPNLAQTEAGFLGALMGGGSPPPACKAGPGHQNTPTINIIDTSQK